MNTADSTSVTENTDAAPVTFDFSKEREQINMLVQSWKVEKDKVDTRRKLRENKKNVEEERQRHTILEDETIIPDRTINLNIERGKVPYIKYITQSQRLLIITDANNPSTPMDSLELWFTRGMRYPKWKFPWFKLIDCFHVHGGAALEVMYDETKPLGVTLEYIPRDSLIFPQKTRSLQACPRILRSYQLTTLELEEYQERYSLNSEIVKDLLDKFRKRDDFIEVFRVLMKKQGIVYNAWYTADNTTGWLRDPIPHDVGLFDFDPAMLAQIDPLSGLPLYLSPVWQLARQEFMRPLPLKEYPLFWFIYRITENETILEAPSRTSLDLHEQEALTHLLTNTVNSSTRASHVYASAKNEPGQDPAMRELGKLSPGVIAPHELNFWSFPWPNNIILSIIQALDTRKASQTGQSDYAAMARKDANKTATEMELAEANAEDNKVIEMDVYSAPVLDVLTLSFNIAVHQAVFGLIPRPQHPELLLLDHNLSPAGDVEVVKRHQDMRHAQEFFNIVQGTPLAQQIFVFLLQKFFPDQADEWIKALEAPDKDQLIAQLVEVLKSVPTDELPEQQRAALRDLIAAAQAVVGVPGNAAAAATSGAAQGPSPAQGNGDSQVAGQQPANQPVS